MPNYQVWYKRNYIQDTEQALEDFANCYVPIMRLEAEDLEDVFIQMQGEMWSPNGEARQAIRDFQLDHTSMSIGDVVENLDDGTWSEVLGFGFQDITKFMRERV